MHSAPSKIERDQYSGSGSTIHQGDLGVITSLELVLVAIDVTGWVSPWVDRLVGVTCSVEHKWNKDS